MIAETSIWSVLKNKEYSKFSVGYLCYWLSYSFELFLIGIIAWRITENAGLVSLVYSLELLPSLVFGPMLSTLSDRYNRITIVRLSIIAKVIKISGVILFLISGSGVILILCISSFIDGVLTAADEPALHSTIPNLVDEQDIPLAVSLNGAISFFALVIGPALCGYFLFTFGEIFTYTSALIFSIMYLAVWFTIPLKFGVAKTSQNSNLKNESIVKQITLALQYLWQSGIYIYVLLIVVNALLVRSFYYTAVIQSGYFFDGSIIAQTFITTAIGAGLVIGAIIAFLISRSNSLYRYGVAALFLVAFSYILSPLIGNLWIYSGLWTIYGIGFSISLNLGKAALHAACEDEFRGRVAGFISYIPRGAAAISTPIVGILIASFGLTTIFWITALLISLAVISLIVARTERSFTR